jgi:hypothetical protein
VSVFITLLYWAGQCICCIVAMNDNPHRVSLPHSTQHCMHTYIRTWMQKLQFTVTELVSGKFARTLLMAFTQYIYTTTNMFVYELVSTCNCYICYTTTMIHRCYRRNLVGVRFNRVADAIAAYDDLLQLQLTSSGQQTERPKRCKVVLKPASFDRGVYEQLRSDTPLTTSSTDEHWQQEQQQLQQLQQHQQSFTAAPVQLRVAVAAPPAALRSDRNDSLQPTATATTSATANAVRHATVREQYGESRTTPALDVDSCNRSIKQELDSSKSTKRSDSREDRIHSKKRASSSSRSHSREKRRRSSRNSDSRDRYRYRSDSRSRRRSRSYNRARSRSSYTRGDAECYK